MYTILQQDNRENLKINYLLRTLNILCIWLELVDIYLFLYNGISTPTIQYWTLHGISVILNGWYQYSNSFSENAIFKFLANIFCTIFIMLFIVNVFILMLPGPQSQVLYYLVLAFYVTGPAALASFTLILLMTYETLR